MADGHHRSAAAYNVGKMRRERAVKAGQPISGEEDFNYFMSILYPSDQLQILDYNRLIKTLNGLTTSEFLERLEETYATVTKIDRDDKRPLRKHTTSLFIDGHWYECEVKQSAIAKGIEEHGEALKPVASLDVQVLNDRVFSEILGIDNVRTDNRVDFVGGSRGIEGLVRRCQEDAVAGFAMHPLSINDVLDVADSGLNMPPKGTWFEPKPRSGFVVRCFEEKN